MYEYYGIIFKSIGIKQNILTGIISELEKHNILNIKHIKYFGGINTGSIIATLCAADFSLFEIQEILNEFYLQKNKFNFTNLLSCFKNSQNESLMKYSDFINSVLYDKFEIQEMMFKDLYNKTKKHLKVAGFNLSNKTIFYMDHVNTPNMLISDAICISICDPTYFKPVFYNNKQYIDASLINFVPYNLFTKQEEYNILFVNVLNTCTEKTNLHESGSIMEIIRNLSVLNEINIPINIKSCLVEDTSNINIWKNNLTKKEINYFHNVGKYHVSLSINLLLEQKSPIRSPKRKKHSRSLDIPRQHKNDIEYKEKVIWYLNSLNESIEEKKLTNTVE